MRGHERNMATIGNGTDRFKVEECTDDRFPMTTIQAHSPNKKPRARRPFGASRFASAMITAQDPLTRVSALRTFEKFRHIFGGRFYISTKSSQILAQLYVKSHITGGRFYIFP